MGGDSWYDWNDCDICVLRRVSKRTSFGYCALDRAIYYNSGGTWFYFSWRTDYNQSDNRYYNSNNFNYFPFKMTNKYNKYIKEIQKTGANAVKLIEAKKVVVENWVRLKCQFGCDAYGTRLTCPPFSPTPEYTRQMIKEYKTGIFFIYKYDAIKERKERRSIRKTLAKLEREMFLDGYYKAFAMGAGPCNLCPSCDVKNSCLHTEQARPSLEACGIDVYKTAYNAGVKLKVVKSYKDVPTYCCLILIE